MLVFLKFALYDGEEDATQRGTDEVKNSIEL